MYNPAGLFTLFYACLAVYITLISGHCSHVTTSPDMAIPISSPYDASDNPYTEPAGNIHHTWV